MLLGFALSACRPAAGSDNRPALRWGGDAEGGAPFVEADATNPDMVRGFDVEIAGMMAQGLARKSQFVQVAWSSIEQSLLRGDFDVGMSGVEDSPALRKRLAVSVPYFEFQEVLAVRPADTAHVHSLADLSGRRVATLASTRAYSILLDAQKSHGVIPVSYDDDVHPYEDLASGRVDAVLLDHVIANRAWRRTRGFVVLKEPVAIGHYVAVFPPGKTALRDSVNAILLARLADGSMERTFRKWDVWDENQRLFQTRLLSGLAGSSNDSVAIGNPNDATNNPEGAQASTGHVVNESHAKEPSGISRAAWLPSLLRAALLTMAISVAAMLLAVAAGLAIAAGRIYGGPALRTALLVYVEVIRGTPVLLQLFVLYYGLSGVVRLAALPAAILGLGLNYAAYESEIYRSALLAVPRQQLEAARTLGLSEWLTLRLVRGPQAMRLAMAPMTNDFVALLKDSSLVSVITVVELTKQTAIYATNAGSWLVPGVICASLYLAMSLPLSHLARRLESRWSQ